MRQIGTGINCFTKLIEKCRNKKNTKNDKRQQKT